MSDKYRDQYSSVPPPQNYEQFFVPAIGKPLAEDLVRTANLKRGDRVLDVACGSGIVARLAASKVIPGGSVSGLDPNPGMLSVAHSATHKEFLIDWYEAAAEAIPLGDNIFDVVLCQMGLQFMEDKVRALKEMRRVLIPGGRLIINMPGPIEEPFTTLAETMAQTITPQARGFVHQVFSLYEPGDIQDLLNAAGFADVAINSDVKMLQLPAPDEFLWQYIYSTPLSAIVSDAKVESLDILEKTVTEKWQDFSANGSMKLPQGMVTVFARK